MPKLETCDNCEQQTPADDVVKIPFALLGMPSKMSVILCPTCRDSIMAFRQFTQDAMLNELANAKYNLHRKHRNLPKE